MIIQVKLLLLSFGVGLSVMGEFQDYSSGRFGTTGSLIHKFVQGPTTESSLQLRQTLKENETIHFEDINPLPENGLSQGISNITEMLRRTSTCRERNFKAHNRMRGFKPRGGSMHRGRAWFGRNSNISVFHCNISKELVDGLKDKLQQLEIFQDIIVLYPKNRSSSVDRLSTSHAPIELNKYHKSFLPKKDNKNAPGRMVRDTLLKNDQIESNAKVLQVSHIYLGRSQYPLFTEESRVIGRDHTLPPPVYTKGTHSYGDENWVTPGVYKQKMKS